MENHPTKQSTFSQDDLPLTIKEEFSDEDLIIIWLNDSKTNHLMDICSDLTGIINNFKLFNDVDQCIDYITSIHSNIYVFFILSSHQFIIPLVHRLPQIKFIYIFNINQTNDDENKYAEIGNIFNDKQSLIDKLNEDVELFSKQLSTTMTFFNNADDNIKEKSLKDLSKESQYFMYMHLFMEILLRHSQPNKAKDDLFNECQQCYHNNKNELNKIDRFKKEYHSNEAIRWYTRDSFLYRLLNKALRCQDFDTSLKNHMNN